MFLVRCSTDCLPCFLLCQVRRCVEQTFGILKAQWNILKEAGEYSLKWKTVDAYNCVLLHNMMIRYREAVRCRDEEYYAMLQAEFDTLAADILKQLEAEAATDDAVSPGDAGGVLHTGDAVSERERKLQAKLWQEAVADQLFNDESKGNMPFAKSAARTDRSGKRGPQQPKKHRSTASGQHKKHRSTASGEHAPLAQSADV